MTTIYWVRHAEAEGNLYRRCHGQYDSLVTENGKAQILALRKRFRNIHIDAVVSSDLYRTRKTAEAVALPRKLEIKTHPGLREINLGVWEDLTWCDLGRRWPELDDVFSKRPWEFDIEGGESITETAGRGLNALKEIASEYKNQTVAVFSHGMVTRAVMALVSGLRLDQMNALHHGDNTSVTLIEIGGKVDIKYYADNSHLGDLSTLARQNWWRESTEGLHDDGFWYRAPEFETESHIVEAYRRDAWRTIYGTLDEYNARDLLDGAKRQAAQHPMAVVFAMNGDEIAGLLQLDTEFELKPGAGHISFFYLEDRFRGRGLGVQLLGQAVSFFRELGRSSLALRVSDKNTNALRFYKKYGFTQFGKEKGFSGKLLLLELNITQT